MVRYGQLILKEFGIECKEISLEEATQALGYAAGLLLSKETRLVTMERLAKGSRSFWICIFL
jgi:hypothetical protein